MRYLRDKFYATEYAENEAFRGLMDFIEQRALPESYTWRELEDLASSISADQIEDACAVLSEVVQRTELEDKHQLARDHNNLIGLQSFLPLRGTETNGQAETEDLGREIVDFALSAQAEQRVFGVFGDRGQGKSLLLLRVYRELLARGDAASLEVRYVRLS